ncbi:MAG: cytochrome b/b6 domain-containing protein [Gammaproteobacteria bacterium]|nr:cytochrome b/b6 domain-containing protein [Gammaproteobacteria bacterium]
MENDSAIQQTRHWVHRHSYNARICHWINVLCFVYLLLSGIMIFLQFPELYWGKVGFQGYDAVFKLSDWGLSWEEADALGNRRWGRNYHYLFAWVFVINGLIYLGWNLWQKRFYSKMLPRREELSVKYLKADMKNHLRFRAPTGTAARQYGVLQKISYLLVLFVLFPFMIVSGFAQMPAFTAISPELIDLFGGRQSARTLHVICTVLLLLFVVVHLIEVLVAGAVNQVRSMITGRYVVLTESAEGD